MSTINYALCDTCTKRKFDLTKGVLCGLTGEKPNFIGNCPTYEQNQNLSDTAKRVVYNTNLVGQASGGERFANLLIDGVILGVLGFVIGIGMVFSANDSGLVFINQLLGMVISIIYYTILEAALGQSVGKLVTGTIVVSEDGKKPTFGKILGRSFCRHIPFNALSFLGSTHSGWHDRITKTKVVKKSVFLASHGDQFNQKPSELLDEYVG